MTTYFVTGATGFIGRHLVERLLEREGDIYVLVREGSREKLDALIEGWGQPDRIKPVVGDLGEHHARRRATRQLPKIDHFFHLAAIYDMAADETRNALLNVGGTQNAIDLANALEVGTLPPHVLDRRRRPLRRGHVQRGHVRRGPEAGPPVPPHEVRVREARPRARQGAVPDLPPVASSSATRSTGEMDKIDGPYYFFKLIQKVRHALPEWFPLISLEWGWTNIVPVDYVAAAVDHIAHKAEPRRPDRSTSSTPRASASARC